VYRPVARGEIADTLIHIRDLYRQIKPANDAERRAHERREVEIKNLLSNLPRIKEHPTLNIVDEIGDVCRLTIDGRHRLFGYNLGAIREYDMRLNGGRTHVIESYAFERDWKIDLPLRFGTEDIREFDGMLGDLVPKWQTGVPVRALEENGWLHPGAFFVHVGTEDSLGSSLPPGSLALIDPIEDNGQLTPGVRSIYLLQFGNGFRCSRCIVSRGKLQLLAQERTYSGIEEFSYPDEVRIVGKVLMFALNLPTPEYSSLYALPRCRTCASLIMPCEQQTRDGFLADEYRRFQRAKDEREIVKRVLQAVLGSSPSKRTERRYRSVTSSDPHVDTLIHFTVQNFVRYTDVLKTGGSLVTDTGYFSLETLRNSRFWTDVLQSAAEIHVPAPASAWEGYRRELLQWAPIFSTQYPELHLFTERAIRLARGTSLQGLDPAIGPGSWMFLEDSPATPDIQRDQRKSGWSRPIYALRRGIETLCGYLDRDGDGYALLSNANGHGVGTRIDREEVGNLRRAEGIIVPV
jgi:hypothetical protein